MCAGAFFTSDYAEICDVLASRIRAANSDTCIAAIVFANARTKLFKDDFAPCIAEWHWRSEEKVHFIFVGFEGRGDPREQEFNPELSEASFKEQLYVDTITAFEQGSSWRYTGEPCMLIVDARIDPHRPDGPAELVFDDCISVDLAKALRAEPPLIESVPRFFAGLIRFAMDHPGATVWRFGDRAGITAVGSAAFKELIDWLAKWLKLEGAQRVVELGKLFAVRDFRRTSM